MTDFDERAAQEPSAAIEMASDITTNPYCEGEDRMPDEEVALPGSPAVRTAPEDGAASNDALRPRLLTIVNRRGLHARASAKFVQTAEAFDAAITVSREDMTVGGQSIMGLMMLAASLSTTITVSATGPEADQALDAIERLVADRFGEEC